jgi:hypothetical protein
MLAVITSSLVERWWLREKPASKLARAPARSEERTMASRHHYLDLEQIFAHSASVLLTSAERLRRSDASLAHSRQLAIITSETIALGRAHDLMVRMREAVGDDPEEASELPQSNARAPFAT